MASEKTFYSDQGGIRITNTRAIFGSKTYVMNNMASVSTYKVPANRKPGIIVLAIGILVLLVGFAAGPAAIVIGLLGIALGVLILYLIKDTWAVRISSSSGEVDALAAKDRAYIEKIVAALNEAIIARG